MPQKDKPASIYKCIDVLYKNFLVKIINISQTKSF